MKIVHIITSLNVGGAEITLKRLILGSMDQSIVISLTNTGLIGKQLREQGVEVHALGMEGTLDVLNTIIKLRKLLLTLNPDIVQTWLYHADLIGGISAKFAGIKIVVWGIHTTALKKGSYKTSAIRFMLAALSYFLPEKILCVATAGLRVHQKLGYAKAKLKVINNGCDLEKFTFNANSRASLRRELGVTTEQPLIGMIARFSQEKGPDLFIDSAKIVTSYRPDVRFVMLGTGMDSHNKELKSWLDNSGISDKFILLGESESIESYLSCLDIFCLTSRTEAFPNILLEAMATRCICVVTNVGDVASILKADEQHSDARLGVLVPQVDARAIGQAVIKVLSTTDREREQIREAAYQKVLENYNQKLINSQDQQCYKALLDEVLA